MCVHLLHVRRVLLSLRTASFDPKVGIGGRRVSSTSFFQLCGPLSRVTYVVRMAPTEGSLRRHKRTFLTLFSVIMNEAWRELLARRLVSTREVFSMARSYQFCINSPQ